MDLIQFFVFVSKYILIFFELFECSYDHSLEVFVWMVF